MEIISLDNKDKWFNIVKQFKNHDVYYFPQYAKAFQIHGDGDPFLIYYQSDNMKAINVVMKRDIADCEYLSRILEKNTMFDIVTPYGYGGFLIEGVVDNESLENMNKEYSAYCQDQSIVTEFVRFHPLLNNHVGLEPVYEISKLGRTISMDLSSPQVIYSNIKPNTRNRIRKAEAHGIRISFGNTKDLFTAFKEIYDETMERNKADDYYFFSYSFYESIRNDLKDDALIFYATLNEEIIAMGITLCCNKKMYSHLQASRKEYMHLSPVALLDYQTALWGYENGMDVFYLGGGVGSKEDSLYQYKSNFNRNCNNRFMVGKKIFDEDKYNYLLSMREKYLGCQLDTSFFPTYRAKNANGRKEDDTKVVSLQV